MNKKPPPPKQELRQLREELLEVCRCGHERLLHSHAAYFCLAARCRCNKFQPIEQTP